MATRAGVLARWAERAAMVARGCARHATRGSSSSPQAEASMKPKGGNVRSPLYLSFNPRTMNIQHQDPSWHVSRGVSWIQNVIGSPYSIMSTQLKIRCLCGAASKVSWGTSYGSRALLQTTNSCNSLSARVSNTTSKRSYGDAAATKGTITGTARVVPSGQQRLPGRGVFRPRHFHYGPPPSWKDQLWKLAGGVLLVAFVISFFSVIVTIGTFIIGTVALAALGWFAWRKLKGTEFIRTLQRNPWFSKYWNKARGKAEESHPGELFRNDSSVANNASSGFANMFPFIGKVINLGLDVGQEIEDIQQKALEILRNSPEATKMLGHIQATMPTTVQISSIDGKKRYDIKFVVHGDKGYGELGVQVENDDVDDNFNFLDAKFVADHGREIDLKIPKQKKTYDL